MKNYLLILSLFVSIYFFTQTRTVTITRDLRNINTSLSNINLVFKSSSFNPLLEIEAVGINVFEGYVDLVPNTELFPKRNPFSRPTVGNEIQSSTNTNTRDARIDQSHFYLTPIPVENSATIRSSKLIKQYIIYDVFGREEANESFNLPKDVISLSLNMLLEGLYTIKIIYEDNTIETKRFTKQ